MAERNASISEDRRIEFRIGINVGDIIIDEGDIYGDGVNIAARVEALARPGAICVSENAYQQVKGKLALDVSDMGEQQLKNIAQPVRVYGVRLLDASAVRGADASRQAFDRRVAVPEYERRSGAGILRRRPGRGHHHRPVAIQMAFRHRPQLDLCL